jgi:hypothetical protein
MTPAGVIYIGNVRGNLSNALGVDLKRTASKTTTLARANRGFETAVSPHDSDDLEREKNAETTPNASLSWHKITKRHLRHFQAYIFEL